jgi:hypothetical protein
LEEGFLDKGRYLKSQGIMISLLISEKSYRLLRLGIRKVLGLLREISLEGIDSLSLMDG